MKQPVGKIAALACGLLLAGAAGAHAATAEATINKIDENGVGAALGTVRLEDSAQGLKITPDLHGLPAGKHGFHVHANADCNAGEQNGKKVAGLAAGGHYDPQQTGKHRGPDSSEGHKGDLPVLVVDDAGKAGTPMLAPRLKVEDVKGHALIIHGGGDNYADEPALLGGGGPRIACGVIK